MANVWVGENYYIKSIHEKDTTPNHDNTEKNITSEGYLVTLQRLPEASYSIVTEVYLDTRTDSIALSLSDDALVAALLPKINTALATDDSSDKSEDHAPTALDDFTLKI